jgi:hypothetical protein
MDDPEYVVYTALLQHFQALVTQFQENHAAWEEAVRGHDLPHQLAMGVRHRAILTEAREVLAAFRALSAS